MRAEIPEIDAVFGAEDWNGIGAYARTVVPLRLDAQRYDLPENAAIAARPSSPRPSAYLKISDGCNAPCTFCIIPKMKGKLHSTPAEALIEEAQRLADEGVREIVLVAQDSTDYGRDLGLRDGLPELLERLSAAVPGRAVAAADVRLPGHVTRRLAETMAALPNVAHYIDIPLQHASESVLRRMKRPSNTRMVREMFGTLRDGDAGHRAADDVHRRLSGRDGAASSTSCWDSCGRWRSTTSAASRSRRSPSRRRRTSPDRCRNASRSAGSGR